MNKFHLPKTLNMIPLFYQITSNRKRGKNPKDTQEKYQFAQKTVINNRRIQRKILLMIHS